MNKTQKNGEVGESPPLPRRKRKADNSYHFQLGSMLRGCVEDAIAPLLARLEAVEKSSLRWAGTWRSGEQYRLNDICQDKGKVFVAVAPEPLGRPGTCAGWRQMGREGQ